ncbi:uncharacterized protein LOC134276090 [Saccostrea cucullata]|uniref:uncharacterized protein LOC134276090 n=1 Tax=Saccostrea cuccullata TaxID=36930 RepID=UPI002ED50028
MCCQIIPENRPSFDRVSIWTESLLVHLEHGGPLPPELQGDPIEFYYAVREGRAPKNSAQFENKSRLSLDTITEQNKDTSHELSQTKKFVIENIVEKTKHEFGRDRSYSENSVSKSSDLLSVTSSNAEESLSDIDASADVSSILDRLNFQECTSDVEISSTFGDTKLSLPNHWTLPSNTDIDSEWDQVLQCNTTNGEEPNTTCCDANVSS